MSSYGWGTGPTGTDVPNLSISDPTFTQVNVIVNTTLNILSIVGGLLVVFITAGLWLYDRRLMDRVSLRLNAFISLVDVIRSAIVLAYTFMSSDTAVAFNLQWVVLQERVFLPWMEHYLYYGGSFLLALIFTCVPLIAGKFGWDHAQSMCWYRDSWTTSSIIWEWTTYLGPAVIVIVYCNVVVGLVIRKIVTTNRALRKHIGSNQSGKITSIQRSTQRAINRVLARIVLYPFIPFITQTPFIASEAYMHTWGQINLWLSLLGNIATDSPGILNFIAFAVDPSFSSALSRVRRELIDKYAQPASYQMTSLPLGTSGQPLESATSQSGFMYWFVNKILYRPRKPASSQTISHTAPSSLSRQSWHVLVDKDDHSPNSRESVAPTGKKAPHSPFISGSQSLSEDEHLGPSAARRYIQNL
ncbi:hypothetical protein K493DRAFT_298945 [Basidiobolus meristosporus CBS 931.73]|uniref:G-protein coupled receptors family 2 profile 2 domain-containing protein n=1 Tax=Basidiobolus meristosporus CBS 931.73 TaxID=1314790 RepID=A0A1Y1YQU4_9FUNG|nr:hypothetical protein K493DRAFT_298945 [Basidiobolus meristosporus CBS 931.73]|eukprot:ORY00349.1 hypothetical protein K493DRAFT_298945 [Basidiobolus meristosporus CBS 931.73]